ncbi:MAG: alpha/beta hydrolase [Sporichthyaceae bacterium]|nr:alpha/beta hydrolase [Sporichthyaceae bacterium]
MSTPRFLDLPGCARAERIETTRGTFAAHVAEPADSATARGIALLVPGFTGSKEDFIGILEPLSARGYRVVAVDPRGHYQTPGPDDESGYAPGEQAEDVVALVVALTPDGHRGPAVHLVGHSLGGVMARHAAQARPDLVRSLALLCTGPAALSGDPAELVARQLAALEQYDLAKVAELREQAGEGTNPSRRIKRFLRKRFVANNKAALLAESRYLLGAPDRVDDVAVVLRDAGLPILVTHGSSDDAWPSAEQREMAERLGATYTVIAGSGHSPAVDDPVTTADVLCDFWKRAELLTT